MGRLEVLLGHAEKPAILNAGWKPAVHNADWKSAVHNADERSALHTNVLFDGQKAIWYYLRKAA